MDREVEREDKLNESLWMGDECLKHFRKNHLSEIEIEFWKDFIPKYLHPLEENKEKERQVSKYELTFICCHACTQNEFL